LLSLTFDGQVVSASWVDHVIATVVTWHRP